MYVLEGREGVREGGRKRNDMFSSLLGLTNCVSYLIP